MTFSPLQILWCLDRTWRRKWRRSSRRYRPSGLPRVSVHSHSRVRMPSAVEPLARYNDAHSLTLLSRFGGVSYGGSPPGAASWVDSAGSYGGAGYGGAEQVSYGVPGSPVVSYVQQPEVAMRSLGFRHRQQYVSNIRAVGGKMGTSWRECDACARRG
jgi:hypothetical protein